MDLHLHADNCSGQNKNSAMLQYLLWRIKGKNRSLTLLFFIAGNTKFAPDRGFSLVKRAYRRTKVDCLDELKSVVEDSSAINECQLVSREDGEVKVPTDDWTDFTSRTFRKLDGILQFQHFSFNNNQTIKMFL